MSTTLPVVIHSSVETSTTSATLSGVIHYPHTVAFENSSSCVRMDSLSYKSCQKDSGYTPDFGNLTLFYGCSSVAPALVSNAFICRNNDSSTETGFYTIGSIPNVENNRTCNFSITVPVLQTAAKAIRDNVSSLTEVLNHGFEVQWIVDDTACTECVSSGGYCGYNTSYFQPICFCPDQPYTIQVQFEEQNFNSISGGSLQYSSGSSHSLLPEKEEKEYKSASYKLVVFWKKKTRNAEYIEDFLKKCGSFAPKRYNYKDVKKMTNSFKDKLGQGGYGDVYKGKLPDDRLVAVKVLSETKGNGEEFLNEVASISRTAHVNIVTLLGFCYEGSKRALIYEFMPKGSLEKYIYDESKLNKILPLGSERIYHIAIGIANGLVYLHQGCNTQILHLDIKPQNILLDQDFCPKISDFGLAKLCNRKESTMSLLGARGTVGYIAPEVFSRTFGIVSHKSDVYSYGMMILEMVAGRKNLDAGLQHSSEIYFPHWIYKRLELGDLKPLLNMNKAVEELARKMILVGLWCIQSNPADRPSMDKVVDMLEGSHEAIQLPPRPFPSSPMGSPEGRSTTSSPNPSKNSVETLLSH
uniref:Protein kinase domain-containing protein n=1 Tax=Fagus sylvatica TaxID=28930 RepID=A0A2N9IZ64_FAGSY